MRRKLSAFVLALAASASIATSQSEPEPTETGDTAEETEDEEPASSVDPGEDPTLPGGDGRDWIGPPP